MMTREQVENLLYTSEQVRRSKRTFELSLDAVQRIKATDAALRATIEMQNQESNALLSQLIEMRTELDAYKYRELVGYPAEQHWLLLAENKRLKQEVHELREQ